MGNALFELLPAVRALSRAEKLGLIQLLAVELLRDEAMPPDHAPLQYPVWTPLHAFEAAEVLSNALQASFGHGSLALRATKS